MAQRPNIDEKQAPNPPNNPDSATGKIAADLARQHSATSHDRINVDPHQRPTTGPTTDPGQDPATRPKDKRGAAHDPAVMKLKSPTDEPIHVGVTSGEAIEVGPDGRNVPRVLRKEALVAGCIPADSTAEDMRHTAADPTEQNKPAILRKALKKLVDAGVPLDGTGRPNRKAVSDEVGWSVSAVELTEAWDSLNR